MAVVEATDELALEDVAIMVAVRIVAVDAGHRAAAVTVAEKMIALVAERTDAAIDVIRILAERGQFQ